MNSTDIEAAFQNHFRVIRADTEDLRREVYRIRYEVYCKELHYEDVARFPDGLERDSFDERSIHCLLQHCEKEIYAGCVRMVFNDVSAGQLLPFEQNCASSQEHQAQDIEVFDRKLIGEASRLAIPAYFRRRKADIESPLGEISDGHDASADDKRKFSCIAPGLYLAAASIALHAGLKGVFAMMEPRLVRHLVRFGIRFQQIGNIVDYHGPRAAFFIRLDTLYEGLRPEMQSIFDIIHSDLHTGTAP